MTPHKHEIIPEKYVSVLELNKLTGRIVHIPNKKKRQEILLIYGHHTSLERMYPFMQELSAYGTVTAPDLPGFGGMDSLYAIGEEPSIDTLADYTAAVIKLRYKRRPLTIVGCSLGFLIVTRMLQKYPDIAQQAVKLISIAGFVSYQDFKMSRRTRTVINYSAALFSGTWSARIFRNTALLPFVIRSGYRYTPHAKEKLRGYNNQQVHQMLDFEVELWRCNDVRTHMRTITAMLTADITRWPVAMPLYHVSMPHDQYLNQKIVLSNLRRVYANVSTFRASTRAHLPTIYLEDMDAGVVFPPGLRRLLARGASSERNVTKK